MIRAYNYIVEVTKHYFNRSECFVEYIKYIVYIFVNSLQRTMEMISAFKCFVILVKTFMKTTEIRFIKIKNLLK